MTILLPLNEKLRLSVGSLFSSYETKERGKEREREREKEREKKREEEREKERRKKERREKERKKEELRKRETARRLQIVSLSKIHHTEIFRQTLSLFLRLRSEAISKIPLI